MPRDPVACPQCGLINPPGQERCDTCGARFRPLSQLELQVAQEQYEEAVIAALAVGTGFFTVVARLRAEGWPEKEAVGFVRKTESKLRHPLNLTGFQEVRSLKERARDARAANLRSRMLPGLFLALTSVAITVATYNLAGSTSGGYYVVAWGGVLIGSYFFLRGLWSRFRP